MEISFLFASDYIIEMENSVASEYNIDNVYRSFNNVIDQSDNQSIRLREFIIAFRELTKQVLIR